jgi:hypothetical protein
MSEHSFNLHLKGYPFLIWTVAFMGLGAIIAKVFWI